MSIRIIDNPLHGVASARNLGAKNALGDWLLFLDDDMIITQDNIIQTLNFTNSTDQEICCNINWEYPDDLKSKIARTQFGRFLNYYGFSSFQGWNNNAIWKSDGPFEAQSITSQFLFIRKNTFQSIGGYNEAFPHAGFEDYALLKTLQKQAIKIFILPNTKAYHNEADRIKIGPWLERRKRGSETRNVAVGLGYEELAIHFGLFKSLTYVSIFFFRKVLIILLKLIPNVRFLDKFYFLVVNALYGAYTYSGYKTKRHEE
jgi:GT2 family glycosyltransferase